MCVFDRDVLHGDFRFVHAFVAEVFHLTGEHESTVTVAVDGFAVAVDGHIVDDDQRRTCDDVNFVRSVCVRRVVFVAFCGEVSHEFDGVTGNRRTVNVHEFAFIGVGIEDVVVVSECFFELIVRGDLEDTVFRLRLFYFFSFGDEISLCRARAVQVDR